MYFYSRFGGLRNRRVLETHSKSLEEAPSYYRDHEARDREAEEWEHRSWCGGWPGQSEHHVSGHQPLPGHHNHRRLPQTPRRPSTLLSMSGVSSLGLPGQQQTNINGQSLLNQQNIQQHNLQNQQHHTNQPPLNQKVHKAPQLQAAFSIKFPVSNRICCQASLRTWAALCPLVRLSPLA